MPAACWATRRARIVSILATLRTSAYQASCIRDRMAAIKAVAAMKGADSESRIGSAAPIAMQPAAPASTFYGGGGGDYSYGVSGQRDDGDDVTGSIEAYRGDSDVDGTVELDDGTEVEIQGEWTGHGKVEATDDDGNTYELDVDD